MLKLLSNEVKYEEKDNFKGWAFTIMRNLFINNYRKVVKFKKTDTGLYPLENITVSNIGTPDNILDAKDIQQIIGGFNEDFKKPFSMYLAGYSYQEIADEIEVPLGTVKSRIFYVRTKLKVILAEYNNN